MNRNRDDMRYDDRHRMFLQILMHAGIMRDYEFQQAAANIFRYNNSGLFVAFINKKLEPLDMMICSGQCELTGEKYWMLTSTVVDNVMRFQTQFSQSQLELLRKIFTEIISSLDGSVSSIVCLNYCNNMDNKITKSEAEVFLNDCVQQMWLCVKDGIYYMGVRSIIDLMPYFKNTYEEGFNNCPLCKFSVFHGQRCDECQVVSHLYCLAKLAQVQNPLKCPNCSSLVPMDNLPEVQEQPEPMTQEENTRERDAESISHKRSKKSSKHRSRH